MTACMYIVDFINVATDVRWIQILVGVGTPLVFGFLFISLLQKSKVFTTTYRRALTMLACVSIVTVAILVFVPALVGRLHGWPLLGPMIFFFGVLTVVNTAFDWAALGVTRALLRRGIERGGWAPLWCGLADLVIAILMLGLLAVAALWALQAFNHMTRVGGGEEVLDAGALLAALSDPARRALPEYWWLYAMLFSTLIPSVVNVMVGALSLVRGLPRLNDWIARAMDDGAVGSERYWMVPALAVQTLFAWVIGVVVMIGAALGLLFVVLPWCGVHLIPALQALAAADLPGALLHALGIG